MIGNNENDRRLNAIDIIRYKFDQSIQKGKELNGLFIVIENVDNENAEYIEIIFYDVDSARRNSARKAWYYYEIKPGNAGQFETRLCKYNKDGKISKLESGEINQDDSPLAISPSREE